MAKLMNGGTEASLATKYGRLAKNSGRARCPQIIVNEDAIRILVFDSTRAELDGCRYHLQVLLAVRSLNGAVLCKDKKAVLLKILTPTDSSRDCKGKD
jgi:hypothetical protein